MKSKFISITSIVFLFFTFLIIFCALMTSCGGDSKNPGDNNENTTAGNQKKEDENLQNDADSRKNAKDSLPEGLNFNGAEIRILHREQGTHFYVGSHDTAFEISVESEIGEIVNDAIYRRNLKVEERLNVKIVPTAIPGEWNDKDHFLKTVNNFINAGSDDFDLIAGYSYYIASLAPQGMLYNLNRVNYLTPDALWWSASCAEQMTIDGKLYYITGDFALTLLQNMYVVYFNKQVAQDNGLENLYRIVLDGEFTIDKIEELSKGIYRDLNGDGKPDVADMYGFATTTANYVDALFCAFDQPIVRKNSDGVPELAMNTPKMVEMVDKMYDFFYVNENTYAVSEYIEDSGVNIENMFIENRTLFMNGILNSNDVLRAMNSDYGILPYPKWNREQTAYYTSSHNSFSLFCIPATCGKTEAVGAAMEALCAESYRSVTPAYYEIALKKKYSRDDETSQMLDIVRDGISFDFGMQNSMNMDDILIIFRNLMTEKKTDFTSRYEKSEAKWQKLLDGLVEAYQDLP
ncbi:MAG: extracellular solute-binding protein [Oscillospiraceae bacterium]|nr:extracellular solute-binding protein [Oscillospiraceae bacterium]